MSPANSDRIWALIENEKGGVFRSDDGGKKWQKINENRSLRQRAWYYSRIYADTQDEDKVYVVNVNYHQSKDGGKTWSKAVKVNQDDSRRHQYGMWFDIADGELWVMDTETGDFSVVS